jgi:serine/threonine protein kinase
MMSDDDDDFGPPKRQGTGIFTRNCTGIAVTTELGMSGSGSPHGFSPGRRDTMFNALDRGRSFRLYASTSFSMFNRHASTVSASPSLAVSGVDGEEETPQMAAKRASATLKEFIVEHGEMQAEAPLAGENRLDIMRGPKVGSGGYATVFCGLNRSNNDLIAIKEISVGDCNEQEFRDVALEFDIIRKLRHPNVVRYIAFDHSSSKQSCRILMEFMFAGSAQQILQMFGPLPESVLRAYAMQIFAGVDFIHNEGITHRDIKPANLLVLANGTLKLGDFGCSKRISERSSVSNHLIGTPVYMAPEFISGSVHQKSDVWSVGCTLLELATGRRPWHETNVHAHLPLMFHITSTRTGPSIPDTVSEGMREFLEACFVRDVKQRQSAGDLLGHPWLLDDTDDQEGQDFISEIGASLSIATANALTNPDEWGDSQRSSQDEQDAPQQLLIKPANEGSLSGSLLFSSTRHDNDTTPAVEGDGRRLSSEGKMHVNFPVEAPNGTVVTVELDVDATDVKMRMVDRKPSMVLSMTGDVQKRLMDAMRLRLDDGSAAMERTLEVDPADVAAQ